MEGDHCDPSELLPESGLPLFKPLLSSTVNRLPRVQDSFHDFAVLQSQQQRVRTAPLWKQKVAHGQVRPSGPIHANLSKKKKKSKRKSKPLNININLLLNKKKM